MSVGSKQMTPRALSEALVTFANKTYGEIKPSYPEQVVILLAKIKKLKKALAYYGRLGDASTKESAWHDLNLSLWEYGELARKTLAEIEDRDEEK